MQLFKKYTTYLRITLYYILSDSPSVYILIPSFSFNNGVVQNRIFGIFKEYA